MSRYRKVLGTAGELATVRYLTANGYRIVEQNVRPFPGMARGEIDIVGWDQDVLVFVEVKTRRATFSTQGIPAEAINRAKRRQVVLLANAYIGIHGIDNVPCRFDVVLVTRRTDGAPHFELVKNAFDGND